jgi:hypothetical protein
MSTFGNTPQSGPGTDGHAPVDPATSPDTEPDTDAPPTEPSLDASELKDGDDADEVREERRQSGHETAEPDLPEDGGEPEQLS